MKDRVDLSREQSEAIKEICDVMVSRASKEEIAQTVLTNLASRIECDMYSIYLTGKAEPTFAIMPRRHAKEEAVSQLKSLVSKAIEAFAQEGISFQNVEEILFDPILSGDEETKAELERAEIGAIKSYLNFPIVVGDKIAGLLSVGSAKGIFGTEDLDIVSGLAHAVGTAIENAEQGRRKE